MLPLRRVRVEAAVALARTASGATNWAGLDHLLKFYRTQVFEPGLGLPRPWQFADMAQHFVVQARGGYPTMWPGLVV